MKYQFINNHVLKFNLFQNEIDILNSEITLLKDKCKSQEKEFEKTEKKYLQKLELVYKFIGVHTFIKNTNF